MSRPHLAGPDHKGRSSVDDFAPRFDSRLQQFLGEDFRYGHNEMSVTEAGLLRRFRPIPDLAQRLRQFFASRLPNHCIQG